MSLLWMRGLDPGSQWTHLVPGLPLGGAGIALVSGGLSLVLIRSRDFVPGAQE